MQAATLAGPRPSSPPARSWRRPLLRRRDVRRAPLLDRLARGDRRGRPRSGAARCRCPGRSGAAALVPARRADRVGRADDVVVDRARPLLGGLRPAARLLRVRARSACSPAASARPRGRSPPGSPSSSGSCSLGAAREGDPVALPGRRARRAPAQPGRLLELARARRGDRRPARALGARRRRHPRAARAAGAVLVYLAELVVVLTYSRAGIAVAVARRARVDRARPRPARGARRARRSSRRSPALVALWAFSGPAITDDLQPYADRVNDGAWFGVLLCAGPRSSRSARGSARGRARPERGAPVRARRSRRVVGVVAAARRSSRRARQERRDARRVPRHVQAEVTQDPEPPRRAQLEQPLDVVEGGVAALQDAPAGGKGAGTFEIARRADPRRLDRHDRAARPAAPVPRRDGDRRLPAPARADRRRRGRRRLRGAAGRGAPSAARPPRSRSAPARSCCTRSSTSTGSSSRSARRRSSCSGCSSGSARGARRGRPAPRSPRGDRRRRRRALLADRAVRVEPPGRLGVQRDRPRRHRGGASPTHAPPAG